MSQSAVPGAVMRLAESKSGASVDSQTQQQLAFKEALETYHAIADDNEKPSRLTLYILNDISRFLSSSELYEADVQSNPNEVISWIVCSFVNGRDKGSLASHPSTLQPLDHAPKSGSKLVINGSTPRSDKEPDYHAWYDEEHGPGLATVPGWNAMRRYALQESYGDIETANFYGCNYYDENSGLGGPIWQTATKTEWTFRIRGNAAKPNIRRVWKIEQ